MNKIVLLYHYVADTIQILYFWLHIPSNNHDYMRLFTVYFLF